MVLDWTLQIRSHFCNKAGEGGLQKRPAEGLGGYAGRGMGGIARVRTVQNSLSLEGLVDNTMVAHLSCKP